MKKNWIKKGIVSLIMLAIFLAPVSESLKMKVSLAQAVKDFSSYKNILSNSYVKWQSSSSSTAEFHVHIEGTQSDWLKTKFIGWDSLTGQKVFEPQSTMLVIFDKDNNEVAFHDLSNYVFDYSRMDKGLLGINMVPWTYSPVGPISLEIDRVPISGLTSNETYTASLYFASVTDGEGGGINLGNSIVKNYYPFGKTDTFNTTKEGDLLSGNDPTGQRNNTTGETPLDLDCSLIGTSRGSYIDGVVGCVAGVLYAVWEVSAVVASYAGKFLDFFVYYSTNSSSYTNDFVKLAWAAVRDIANIFLIIALLYIAIKTILGLNVTDNKKLVGAVIIVALVINFSLFTTKIVIDTSNILAKVFYNNITSKDPNNNLATGASGQKSISVGLVEKYNPQRLIDNNQKYDSSRGMFIFYTVLLVSITLYTAYIFFSIALLFVSRLILLWFSMIFSPLAFVSYTVPFDMSGFGHKEWWSRLIDNAILAPVFIFLLYIVVMLANFLKTITDNTDSVMTVVVPFVILAILLREAKKTTVKYAGELGSAIQGAGAALGGLAIGTAAGGTALLGRAALGKAFASASKSEAANNFEKYRKDENSKFRDISFKDHTIGRIGHYINRKQTTAKDTDHARHEIDELKKKAGLEGVSDSNLSKVEREKLQNTYVKDNRGEIESQIRRGYDGKGEELKIEDKNGKYVGEKDFDKQNRKRLTDEMINEKNVQNSINDGDVEETRKKVKRQKYDSSGTPIIGEFEEVEEKGYKLTKQGEKKVEDELTSKFNQLLKDQAAIVGKSRLKHLETEAKQRVGMMGRIMTKSTSGTYDARNLANVKADKREFFTTKAATALTAAVAISIRQGLKGSLNINAGTPQGSFMKDIGNTIKESLKGMKINVDIGSNSGHGGGSEHSSAKRDSSHGEGGHGGGAHGGGGGHKH